MAKRRISVLLHFVKHDDGVVDGERENGEEADDGSRGDFEPNERIDTSCRDSTEHQ